MTSSYQKVPCHSFVEVDSHTPRNCRQRWFCLSTLVYPLAYNSFVRTRVPHERLLPRDSKRAQARAHAGRPDGPFVAGSASLRVADYSQSVVPGGRNTTHHAARGADGF